MAKKLVRGLKSKWISKSALEIAPYKDSVVFLHDDPNVEDLGSHIVLNEVDFATIAALENLLLQGSVTVTDANKNDYPDNLVGDVIPLKLITSVTGDSSSKIKLEAVKGDNGIYRYTLYHTKQDVADSGLNDAKDAVIAANVKDVTNNAWDKTEHKQKAIGTITVDSTGHITGYESFEIKSTDSKVTAVTNHYVPTLKGDGRTEGFQAEAATDRDILIGGLTSSTKYTSTEAAAYNADNTGANVKADDEKKTADVVLGFKTDGAGHVIEGQVETLSILTQTGVSDMIHKFADSAMHFIGAGDGAALATKCGTSSTSLIEGDAFVYNGTSTAGVTDENNDFVQGLEKGDTLICANPNAKTNTKVNTEDGIKTLKGEWYVVNANWEVVTNDSTTQNWSNSVYKLNGNAIEVAVNGQGTDEDPYVWASADSSNFKVGTVYRTVGGTTTSVATTSDVDDLTRSNAESTTIKVATIGGVTINNKIETPVTSINGQNGDVISTYTADVDEDTDNSTKIGTLFIAGKKHEIYATAATYDGFEGNPVSVTNDGAVHTVNHNIIGTTESIPNALDASGNTATGENATKEGTWTATVTTVDGNPTYTEATNPLAGSTAIATSTNKGQTLVVTNATFDGFGHIKSITKDYVTDTKVTAVATVNEYTLLGQSTTTSGDEKAIGNNDNARYNADVKVTKDSFIGGYNNTLIVDAASTDEKYDGSKNYSGYYLTDSRGTVMSVNATVLDWEEL